MEIYEKKFKINNLMLNKITKFVNDIIQSDFCLHF